MRSRPPANRISADMPMVTVMVIEGVFTPEQKREMISKITDTMVEVEGENLRPGLCT